MFKDSMLRSFIVCTFAVAVTANVSFAGQRGITNTSSSPHAKLRSTDIDDVKWTEGFWAQKHDLCHKVMVPNMWRVLSDPNIGHAWQNFRIAAGLEEGRFKGTWWHDGDLYKWLEATAYVYAVTKDKELDRLMDKVIEVIGKAQQKDGYISTPIIVGHKNVTKRFEKVAHHELYNMGHLMTAGCIHYRATGKTTFLNIAKKTGNYLYETFRPRPVRLAHFGFNPSNIMGAAELYRTTDDRKYLELARIFVSMRGSARGGTDQNQAHRPLRRETEAVGHAVTANYLYAGAADVCAETGDKELLSALEKIWHDVVFHKMYVTGAVGALHRGVSQTWDQVHEAYGAEHQLPNSTAYNETCANIANGMWNWRMLALTGEARFADVLELVLYNSALSGISIDGKYFFYTNVLRRMKDAPLLSWDLETRQTYLNCFCCPPNIVRTIAKAHGWAYNISDKGLWINLYGGNVLDTELADGTRIKLTQETDYPWDGKIRITVHAPDKKEFAVMLRIPGWARGAILKINDRSVRRDVPPGRYFELNRTWSAGDYVELDLPMRVRLIEANPLVEETRNQVAIKRGPIVYCLESPDLPDGVRISEVAIPADIDLTPELNTDLLDGVTVLHGQAWAVPEGNWTGRLYRERQAQSGRKVNIRLIPYYAWSNRGVSEMTVWIPLKR
ncbi:MAG: glycoside hydrolase family 127 protein [Planctomycetota bacterium]